MLTDITVLIREIELNAVLVQLRNLAADKAGERIFQPDDRPTALISLGGKFKLIQPQITARAARVFDLVLDNVEYSSRLAFPLPVVFGAHDKHWTATPMLITASPPVSQPDSIVTIACLDLGIWFPFEQPQPILFEEMGGEALEIDQCDEP